MIIDWKNLAAMTTVAVFVGGIMLILLKNFFQTKSGCENTRDRCQERICHKIEELKYDVKENRSLVSNHYAEIKQELGNINGKLN